MTSDDRFPPPGTSQSISSGGQDVAKGESEAGHHDAGSTGADRPSGGSSARASTGIDPQDPVDPQSPKLQTP